MKSPKQHRTLYSRNEALTTWNEYDIIYATKKNKGSKPLTATSNEPVQKEAVEIPAKILRSILICPVCRTEESLDHILIIAPTDDREKHFAICYICDNVFTFIVKERTITHEDGTVQTGKAPANIRLLGLTDSRTTLYECTKCNRWNSKINTMSTDTRNKCLECNNQWTPPERIKKADVSRTSSQTVAQRKKKQDKADKDKNAKFNAILDLDPETAAKLTEMMKGMK